MAKSVAERLAEGRKNRQAGQSSIKQSSTNSVSERLAKARLGETIKFDTFESDLKALGTTLESVYNEWQPQETMDNTKANIVSMQERLNAYQEYAKLFGGADVTELANSYKDALDNWDNVSTMYSRYKDADSFNVAKQTAQFDEQFKGLTYGDLQSKLKEYAPDSAEYNYLSSYTNYSDLNDFDEALKNATGDYKSKLQIARNQYALDNKFDLYKHYADAEDFEEKSKYWDGHVWSTDSFKSAVSAAPKDSLVVKDKESGMYYVYSDPLYEYINDKNNARKLIKEGVVKGYAEISRGYYAKGYDELTEEEIATYNVIDATEGRDKALAYLDEMTPTLTKRRYDKQTQKWSDATDSGVLANIGLAVATIPANLLGAPLSLGESIVELITGEEYNPYRAGRKISNWANDTRGYISEKIAEGTEGAELFGQNVPSFLFDTSLSIGDSALGALTMGKWTAVLMGTNAYQQKAKEMVEAGEDDGTVQATAIASGLAEMVFEYISVDKLLKIKNIDSAASMIKNALTQAGVEGSEELFTEIANITTDSAIRGKNSELYQMHEDLKERGYSAKEINTEIAKQIGSQLGWATAGGALSGGVMGGGASAKNYHAMNSLGSDIRGNNRVSDMLNIASLSPKESDALAAYNKYANKGINAENIKDAQLGNLYSMVEVDAMKTVASKKATAEQKADAETTLSRLAKMKTENKAAKIATTLPQTEVENVEIGESTLAERERVINEQAKGMSETEANLFRLVDDGKSNAADYADSFNLVVAMAQNEYDQDYILEHRGVLSTGQVNSIYQSVVTNPKMAQQKRLDALIQEQGDNLVIKGTIDDSVIDYNNTGAEGKVNWNSLHPNVKATIAYVSGFSTKVAGMDVQLVTNGRDYGFTGQYDRQGNTMLVDITALTERVKSSDTKGRKDNSKFIISTVAHEVTHWMEEKAPELYKQYDKMVMDALTAGVRSEADVLARRRALLEKAEAKRAKNENRKPREITDKEVRREVIARASEDMLAMSEEGKKFFDSLTESEQKQFVGKIKEVIQNIKNWIKSVLSTLKSDAPEAIELRLLAKDLDAISKKWDEMLRQAAKSNAAMKQAGVNDRAIMESKADVDAQNADIDAYTEEMYNAFGWATYNGVINANERETLLSRYADFKHNSNKYPVTRWGEAVIYSTETPNVIMYVRTSSTIDVPEIARIVRINALTEEDVAEIREEIVSNEWNRSNQPYQSVEDYYGYEFYSIHKARDYATFQEYQNSLRERESRQAINPVSEEVQDGERGNRSSQESGRADSEVVNTDTSYSDIDEDSAGHKLTKEQAEFFKDSKFRDENGNLLRLYHGTRHGGFTKFNTKYSDDGTTIFLTPDADLAETYSGSKDKVQLPKGKKGLARLFEKGTEKGNGQVGLYEVYVNAKKPYILECDGAKWNALPFNEKVKGKTNIRVDNSFDEQNKTLSTNVVVGGKTYSNVFDFSHLDEAVKQKLENLESRGFEVAEYDYNQHMSLAAREELANYYNRTFDEKIANQLTKAAMRAIDDVDSSGGSFAGLVDNKTGEVTRLNTRNISAWAKENGYDSVWFKGIRDVGVSHTAEHDIVGDVMVVFDGKQIKSVDNTNPTKNADIRYSDIDDDVQTTINQTMTMQQAKDMVQRAFVTGMIENFYDGKYKNGDEWLAAEGAEEVAFYIENEYSIVTKYLNHIQGYIDEDFQVQDILNAYANKTLTGKVKKATQWMDLSEGVAVADKRFYAPREIKNAKKKLEIAKQKIDKSNKKEVTKARAEVLLYAHNKGAAETLGLTESELNKMLRQWGGYSASARDISMRFNNNVALSNRWTGIENSSWLNSVQVSEKELARLVKSIEGDTQGFERNYIARTMLALDTHIDWSNLKFVFTGVVDPKRASVRGTYDAGGKLIRASYNSPNTVAHEMGHALDNMWAMELGFGNYGKMTDGTTNLAKIENEQAREWYSHFQDFIHDLTDGADIRSSYSMDNSEVFARFVSSFVQWVDLTATGRKNFGFYDTATYSGDNFQAKHYLAFVKILQEKAMLDSKSMSVETDDVQYSDIDVDSEGNKLTAEQKEYFKDSKVRDENGNLRVVYHGTYEDFTIFDITKTASANAFGKGHYFTSQKTDAQNNYATEKGADVRTKIEGLAWYYFEEMGYTEEDYESNDSVDAWNEAYDKAEAFYQSGKVLEVYLDIKNPVYARGSELYDVNGNFVSARSAEYLKEQGYDGIIDYEVADRFGSFQDLEENTAHYVVFDSNQIKLTSNLTPTETPDIRYSDIDELDDLNAQLKEKHNQVYSASMELKKFDSKAAEDKLYAVMNKDGASKQELDDALQEYAKWGEESGYAEASAKLSALKDEEKLLRREIQKVEDRLHDELKEQIAHWSDEDVKKYVSKAVRKYRTTTRLDKASYLVTTGSMLDFSDGQGYRVKDHREISEILDLPNYAEYSDGMIAFMNMGNIRLQTYGIDVSAMPNAKQFAALRDVIFTVMRENDEFSVDFSKTDGYSAGSVTYSKGTSTSKIIADIKSYFETGVVPEEQSSIRDFLYSDIDAEVDIYEVLGENKRLNKENKTIREDVERLKERLKLERQITHGNRFNENQLDAVAGHIRNLGNSNYSKPELINKLRDVYTYIATSREVTWDDLFARMYGIAEDVLSVAKPVHSPNDYYANIYRDMRNTEISLSKEQKKYVKDMLGVDWHKAFFGKMKVSDKGIPLNSKWQEWAGKYPNEFTETQDLNQVLELLDIYETAKELKEVVEEYNVVEQTRWLANEIYNQYWNVSTIRTTADKYDQQIKRLNAEHRRAMKELRDGYNERLEKQKQYDRAERSRIFKKLREDHIKELQEVRQSGKERMDKYKEEAARKTRIHSITANSLTLNEWLVKNSKDKHIHESMKGPVVTLLQAIDFSSKRALGMWGGDMSGVPTNKDISLQKALSQVQQMMKDASVGKEELVMLYGHELDDDIAAMVESVDNIMRTVGDNEFVLNKMTLNDLITLDNVVRTIKHAVTQMNKFHAVHHAKGIANLAQEEIVYAERLGKANVYNGKSLKAGARKLLAWRNINPYYAFKRFGTAGKKVFEAFQDGYDKFAFNVKEIIDFTNSTYEAKEVQEWEKEIKSFKLRMPVTENELANPAYEPQYQEVQMTVAQIMDLYLLNKRESARAHLLGGGIRVADIEAKGGKVISQSEGAILEQKEIDQIIKTLTQRQIEVADALSKFMNTTSTDWGNEVSMARFGYKAFGEKNYVPMQADKNNLAVDDETEKNNSLFRLLNMSFTKGLTEGANNRLVVSSIFDVFAQHTSDMAKYNALALPVLDAFRWYNYKEKGYKGETAFVTKSVKQAIENAFGKDGQSYITTFLKDLNGQENTSRDTVGRGFFTKAKVAAVGANIRVALLQPTAYLKASANIDNKYLVKALMHKPKIGRAEKYCGMALWKSLGYFDTNVQRGVADQIKHAETTYEKAIELSMKGAEWGDKITFGYLWNAAELEIREKRQDLKVGSDEFYFEVGKRLRDIIYSTQVVDSVMTRSEMMRSPDWGDKLLTTFASEPTIAYNMLADAYSQTQLDARELGSKKAAVKKNAKHMARVFVAYTTTNLVAALVESGFDALRDDDDEEMDAAEFMKLYFENFATNQSIIAKIPWLKEGVSILQGFSSTRMDTQWMQTFSNTLKQVAKLMQGEGSPTKLIKNGLQTISYASGLPFYNAYRDFMAILNKLDILTAEELEEILGDFFE